MAATETTQAPAVSVTDLRPLLEAFSEEDDEHGVPLFLYSSFGYITTDHQVFFGSCNLRKYDLTPEVIQGCLKALPDHDVYPAVPNHATVLDHPHADWYQKGPGLNTAFLGNGLLPKLILQEVDILELLRREPHPNIVRYHGCVVRRGRIVSLVFDRLPMTLHTRRTQGPCLDAEKWMFGITSATSYLHSRGLAHNDLNPHNIMVDEADDVYLIDFGSCQPFGCELITAGTREWIEEEYTTSAQEHDTKALARIRTWLEQASIDSQQ